MADDVFDIHKVEPASQHERNPWHVTHVPTGARVCACRLRRDARRAVATVLELVGSDPNLASSKAEQAAAAISAAHPRLPGWLVDGAAVPFSAWCSAREAEVREAREREARLAELRARWEGRTIHWIEGGWYGLEARVVTVTELALQHGEGCFSAALEWPRGSTSFGSIVESSEIAAGPAPDDMPWHRWSSTWRRRRGGRVYIVVPIGDRWCWHHQRGSPRPRVSAYHPRTGFGTAADARADADAWAPSEN